MQKIFNMSLSNPNCLIFMHMVNAWTTEAANIFLMHQNNNKAVKRCKNFLKEKIHTDTMQGHSMNTIWDTHLGMYDIQNESSFPLL